MCSLSTSSISNSTNPDTTVLNLPKSVTRKESGLYVNSHLTEYSSGQTSAQQERSRETTFESMTNIKPAPIDTKASDTINSPTRPVETIEYPTLDLSSPSNEYVSDEKLASDSELSFLLTEMRMNPPEYSQTYMPYIA
ncbi:hypothetical protein K7432_013184 [Basidiobolus ranarum]|uniref:Uncharacterized protein n=1 Tax=Basidiobolus ranarum TaxID=34480 RepID=A0ABR2VR73_9FUNG